MSERTTPAGFAVIDPEDDAQVARLANLFVGLYEQRLPTVGIQMREALREYVKADGALHRRRHLAAEPDGRVMALTNAERADIHARLASWFGEDQQAFLVSHLAPVVDRIKSEACAQAVAESIEMSRKAEQAERRAEDAEAEVERLKGATARRSCGGSGLYPNEVPGVGTEWVGCPGCEWCGQADGHENGCRLGLGPDETCDHQWLDRPESDTRECLVCGTEVAG